VDGELDGLFEADRDSVELDVWEDVGVLDRQSVAEEEVDGRFDL